MTLAEGEHVLGRDPDVEFFLNSPGVSRRHARIRISSGQATIEDLGSKNGTFVGDARVDGPRVAWRWGRCRRRFCEADAPRAEDPEFDGDPAGCRGSDVTD